MIFKMLLPIGARPNFMKASAIVRAIEAHNARNRDSIVYRLVHTGQHYDDALSAQILRDVDLSDPPINLGIGSLPSVKQLAEVTDRFSEVIARERPDVVLVVGDVNSTLACALATVKTELERGSERWGFVRPCLVHVEAGLRSFDRSMPEEINRILTDAVSDLLYTTEPSAEHNLRREGHADDRIVFVGNTMVDTLLASLDCARALSIEQAMGLRATSNEAAVARDGGGRVRASGPGAWKGSYGVVTLHRASNVDRPDTLNEILETLHELAEELPLLFPVHPRTRKQLEAHGLMEHCRAIHDGGEWPDRSPGLYVLPPRGYFQFLRLVLDAKIVLTDSGGIQEETTILGVPCVTLRNNTERPITIDKGTNRLAGTTRAGILEAAREQLAHPKPTSSIPLWDGRAGERIVQSLCHHIPHVMGKQRPDPRGSRAIQPVPTFGIL